MHRIDDPTAAPALPVPQQPGSPGFFTGGAPATGLSPTRVSADWLNATQEEISYVIETAGLTLSKTDRTQLFQALQRLTRTRLAGPLDLYVSTTGSDTNNGLSPTQAFASVTAAYNDIRDRYDLNGYQATIHVADGSYGPQYCANAIVGPPVNIIGNATTPDNVLFNNANGATFIVNLGATVNLQGFKLTSGGALGDYYNQPCGLVVNQAAVCTFHNLDFGVCAQAHMMSTAGGVLSVPGQGYSYTVSGNAPVHLSAWLAGYIAIADSHITIVNNPAFSTAFAHMNAGGVLAGWNCTFTGTATGPKHLADTNGVILTNTGNVNYFPGSVAGTVSTGGQFT
jgi:hypothetical protein